MSKIIPVSITTTEQAVTLDATYQFAWLRNMGENDALLSDHSGIVAGGDNVTLVKSGESGRIATSGRAVYIKAVSGTSTGEIHVQNFSDAPFKTKGKGGGQSITVEPLIITDNGVYTAPTGKAYSPVTVDVQEQPWEPLQDGYSNFWFELTNDTLSPWLNFSAKTENAVIDWGDGSGEVALDTLTPTHTYAKAGKYVVKVKGVTGIDRQIANPPYAEYSFVLKNVELNSEVTVIAMYGFAGCMGLTNIRWTTSLTNINTYAFYNCISLETISTLYVTELSTGMLYNASKVKSIQLSDGLTAINASAIRGCMILPSLTVPATVTTISVYFCASCYTLTEIHMLPTTPPTLSTNPFGGMPSNYVIYVPQGTLSAYQSAWSAYSDHILEEGQTPNRMMLAKFNSAKTEEVKDDELYQDENR